MFQRETSRYEINNSKTSEAEQMLHYVYPLLKKKRKESVFSIQFSVKIWWVPTAGPIAVNVFIMMTIKRIFLEF